ncbi:MAG: MarR family winged helix-turn-helix transcriptional regulator [Acidimicrobiia bacterium]
MSREQRRAAVGRLKEAVRGAQTATDLMDEAFCDFLGINRTDGRVLDIVDQHGQMTAGDLAREIGLTTGAVTAVVDRLEKADLLQRKGDPTDRRKVLIELTTEARRLGEEVYGPMAQATSPYIESLSDQDLLTVIQFMEANRRVNLELARTVRARIPSRKMPLRYRLEQAKALKTDAKTLLKTIKGEVKDLASVVIDLSGSRWEQDDEGRWVRSAD